MNFGRVLTAMVTPFDSIGRLDLKKTEQLVTHLVDHGSDGLVLGGTTGESPTLTHDEKLQLFRHVVQLVDDEVTIIAGTGSNHTASAAELTKEASETGVDGIMLVTPYYNKPNPAGLYQHFTTIANETDLPVMLYNIPGRSVINMPVETTVALSKVANIVSIKDASGDLSMMSDIIQQTSDDFSLYSGEDHLTLPSLAVGSHGVVSVASHVIGDQMKDMVKAYMAGDNMKAAARHRELLPVMRACFMAPSPAPVKAALNYLGVDVGSVRQPLVDLTFEEFNDLQKVLDRID
ncbi:4-hydroxy-tetrahydrodipicolinate synthase [Alkalibacillus flavidus]|uniref:4-hydroxy-tetrahydrodipicolinate synthase n=1 Tax=Alkalibacillus flavidus TaxID=546021 RepID=A0ABV2KRI6_9BACI